MANNNFKPGGNRFASGNKFKGRPAGGESNSDRPSRPAAGARPDREDRPAKFRGEGKKIFNRSERFNREDQPSRFGGGDRERSFGEKRASFKPEPKFRKPGPFKGRRPGGDNPEQGGNDRRSERNDEGRPERPRYGDNRSERPRYSENRPVRPGYGKPRPDITRQGAGDAGSERPRYGENRPDRPRYNEDRPARPGYGKPRPDNDRSGAGDAGAERPVKAVRPYEASPSEGNRADKSGKRPFNASRTESPRHGGDTRRKPFAPKATEDTPPAPEYDLRRFQGRERKSEKQEQGLIRLNRYIANAGICSRREADTLIASGEIKVNGEVVTEMGFLVKPSDTVTYGKKRLNREKMVYVLLNKPKDFITTTEDPEGRKTVMDLVANASKERIFPVGRLDRNTTGLLLFTNDGELAHKLTHPSNNVSKIYHVELDRAITKEHFQMIVDGLELEDGKAEVDDLAIIGNNNASLGIQIHIGKNRIVRRIFEHLGYEVVALDRVQYASLTKKDLPRGNWRFLSEKEVIRLKYFL